MRQCNLIFPVNQSSEFLVKGSGLYQLLKREVHAVVPILFWVGRIIYLFFLGMRTAQFRRDR